MPIAKAHEFALRRDGVSPWNEDGSATYRVRISTLDPGFWAEGMVGTTRADSDPITVTLDDGTTLTLRRDDVLFIGDNPD